jgi:DNA-binding protein HU-beta
MAKLTKTQITNGIAEGAGISKAQAKDVLETLASMAHANARDGFTIPGIGKVSVRQTKAREMVMRFGPREGETIQVEAKTKLKFTFLKVAKEAILS